MVKPHTVFNIFMYGLVIAYILYINFATYYNSGTNFLNFLIKLFNNWVFRLIFLLIVGFFALDLFPYGGFIFAILLTIAFLNTNMLVYKNKISETFRDIEYIKQLNDRSINMHIQRLVYEINMDNLELKNINRENNDSLKDIKSDLEKRINNKKDELAQKEQYKQHRIREIKDQITNKDAIKLIENSNDKKLKDEFEKLNDTLKYLESFPNSELLLRN